MDPGSCGLQRFGGARVAAQKSDEEWRPGASRAEEYKDRACGRQQQIGPQNACASCGYLAASRHSERALMNQTMETHNKGRSDAVLSRPWRTRVGPRLRRPGMDQGWSAMALSASTRSRAPPHLLGEAGVKRVQRMVGPPQQSATGQ